MKRVFFFASLIFIPVIFFILFEITLRFMGLGTGYALFHRSKQFLVINPDYPQLFFGRFNAAAPQLPEQKFLAQKDSQTVRIVCLGGSTTAGFPFEVNINFPFFLQCFLQKQFPEKHWQVINLGISAVNSHAIRFMLPDVLKLKPDLILIYMGHNEFYGVFGLASSQKNILSNPTFIQWFLKLRTLRLYQLLENLLHQIGNKSKPPKGTLMARMIGKNRVQKNSPIYRQTISNFETNLEHIINFFKEHQIPVLLSTVVSNLKDQAPLSASFFEKSITNISAIKFAMQKRDWDSSKKLILKSLKKHPQNAYLHYLLGQVYYHQKMFQWAKKQFILAKDFDQVPFRAPSQINKLIVKIAQQTNVNLVRTDRLFANHSPHGIFDNTLFLEHLHPNEKGYYLLAQSFKPVIEQFFFGQINHKPPSACLTFSELDIAIGELKITQLVANPPFNQRTHFLARRFNPPLIHQIALKHIKGNLLWDQAHFQLGDYFVNKRHLERGLKEFYAVYAYDSTHITALIKIGDVYFKKKNFETAKDFYLKASRFHPRVAFIKAKLAQVNFILGNVKRSINVIKQIIADQMLLSQLTKHQQIELRYLQALAFVQLGQKIKAKHILINLLRIAPNHSQAQKLLQQLKEKENTHVTSRN